MSTTDDPKVVGPIIREEELVHSEKWLCMKKLHWTDQKGRQRVCRRFLLSDIVGQHPNLLNQF